MDKLISNISSNARFPMSVLVILYVTIFLTLFYFHLPKKVSVLEQWFSWMVFFFLYSSFLSVIVDNANFLVLKDEELEHWYFKLALLVLYPVVMLYYLNVLVMVTSLYTRFVTTVAFLFAFLGIDQLLISCNVLSVSNWSITQSVLSWIITMAIMAISLKVYRKILFMEGAVIR
jgi:hypothetical protein